MGNDHVLRNDYPQDKLPNPPRIELRYTDIQSTVHSFRRDIPGVDDPDFNGCYKLVNQWSYVKEDNRAIRLVRHDTRAAYDTQYTCKWAIHIDTTPGVLARLYNFATRPWANSTTMRIDWDMNSYYRIDSHCKDVNCGGKDDGTGRCKRCQKQWNRNQSILQTSQKKWHAPAVVQVRLEEDDAFTQQLLGRWQKYGNPKRDTYIRPTIRVV